MNNDELRLGIVIKPQSTLVELWTQAVKAWPHRRLLIIKLWVRGKLSRAWSSYESINSEVDAMRTLLHGMGVGKGSRVVVISENRYEWVAVHVATMQLGAHCVALPAHAPPSEVPPVGRSKQPAVLVAETASSYSHKNVVAYVSSIYRSLGEALAHTELFMSLCP